MRSEAAAKREEERSLASADAAKKAAEASTKAEADARESESLR